MYVPALDSCHTGVPPEIEEVWLACMRKWAGNVAGGRLKKLNTLHLVSGFVFLISSLF